jgi:hypothetical protein
MEGPLERFTGEERFDILPLLVATDGAIAALGVDGRRTPAPTSWSAGWTGSGSASGRAGASGLGEVEIAVAQLARPAV